MAKRTRTTGKTTGATRKATRISRQTGIPIANPLPLDIIDVKNKITRYFLTGKPNFRPLVTGVGIGVAPPLAPPSPPSVVIFVESSVADCELQPITEQAQARAQGHSVVLLRAGRFLGQASPGDSIGPYAPLQYNVPPVSAGTFGAVVEANGKQYILSCNHVMAYNGRAPVGTAIVNPGTLDDKNGLSAIGSLSHYVELKPAAWPINKSHANLVDCALAEVTPTGAMCLGPLSPGGVPVASIPPGTPTKVRKTGRTTRTTSGTLCIWGCDGFLDLSFGTFYFTDLMGVIGHGPGPFAAPGDSGAKVVTDPGGEGVGLVMARAYCSGPFASTNPLVGTAPPGFTGYVVLVCPLTAVRDALAKQLKVKPAAVTFKT
jgi:hypothetical protein